MARKKSPKKSFIDETVCVCDLFDENTKRGLDCVCTDDRTKKSIKNPRLQITLKDNDQKD